MADIGTAYVRIAPNMTGIQGKIAAGFKGSAGPATAALGDEVNRNSGPFQSALGKLGGFAKAGGVAIAAGLAAGATGLIVLTQKAIMAQAELEQQIGGSEAVFGEYAKTIQEKAAGAFKTAGLSQQEFLQGANKMGSLFQGAGFSVQQSMEMSSQSMQRASDIASIMGISTSEALEAVTGMAKGNFTMMDNLGVAMNDTSLSAYALEKGLGKTTAQMSIQEKVGLANQLFLEKTAKYAGNYAKENETLSGSLNTTKKAFDNLLTGQGDINGFISSLLNTIKIAIPQITAILPQIVTAIGAILSALVPALGAALPTLIPALISAVVSLIQALVAAMPTIINVLLQALPLLIDAFIKLFLAIIQALPQIIAIIAQAMPTIINSLVNGLTNPTALQAIIMGAVQLLLAIVQAIPIILPALNGAIPTIVKNILATLTSGQFIRAMMNAGVQLLQATIGGIGSMMGAVGRAAWDIIKTIGDTLAPSNLIRIGGDVIKGLWNGIQGMGGWLKDKVISFVRDKIPGPIRDALGIHSPSRVAAALGKQVPAGLAQGIYKGTGMVEKAAINMANSAIATMTPSTLNPSLSGAMTAPMPYVMPAGESSVAGKADIVQNNNIYNQVDLDSVTRELAWQIRR
jgi:phage-related protein